MKNRTFAISAAPAAMPPKPKIAAISAITKNTAAQYNMTSSFVVRGSANMTPALSMETSGAERSSRPECLLLQTRRWLPGQPRSGRSRLVGARETRFHGTPVHIGQEGLDVLRPVLDCIVEHERVLPEVHYQHRHESRHMPALVHLDPVVGEIPG